MTGFTYPVHFKLSLASRRVDYRFLSLICMRQFGNTGLASVDAYNVSLRFIAHHDQTFLLNQIFRQRYQRATFVC